MGNTQFIVKQGENKVASFKTDAQGHFRLTLPAGEYVVLREGAGTIGRWQFQVTVEPGKMASVHWTADSGMR